MALKDLRLKLQERSLQERNSNIGTINNEIDTGVACAIVNHIFDYVGICVREDRSKVKLSRFAKAFIGGILNDNVKNGLNSFVRDMNDADIQMLLNEIQRDLNKRKR